MKQYHIVSIVEHHQNDGDIYNPILQSDSMDGILKQVNDYFEQEENEEHPVLNEHGDLIRFTDIEDIDGATLSDKYGDREYQLSLISLEIPTSYEAYTESKLKDHGPGNPKEKAFAEVFTNELNHQPFSGKEFGKALCQQHPTLQQLFFRLVRDCVKARATETPYSNDERNEGSVKMCRDLADKLDRYPLPIK